MGGKHYRLRKGVDFVQEDGKWFLLSRFPLKAARISRQLAPVLRSFSSQSWKALENLHCLGIDESVEKLESFLSSLVKEGFLEERGRKSWDDPPAVSVIIPVRNRPEDIRNCLDSLHRLDYPKAKLEIVVVDDASTDETPESVAGYAVTLKRNAARRGASYCRNLGARFSTGEILCFLDSDCTVAPDWLNEMVEAFRDPQVTACGGLVDSQLDDTALDRYEQVKSSLLMGHVPKDSRSGDAFFYVPACNLAVRKEEFLSLDGFKEWMEVGEDVDFCWRLVDKGHVLAYQPSARVFHRHRNSTWAFCQRRFEYGTSEALLQGLHRDRRKIFPVWPKSMVFWALVGASLVLWEPFLSVPAVGWLLGDAWTRMKRGARTGLSLNYSDVSLATLRSHLSFLYHVALFFSRYYLCFVFAAGVLSPLTGAFLFGSHLAVGCVQYVIKKPRLGLSAFLLYFSLEQLSYQTGVWWGCLRTGLFSPVLPELSLRSPFAVGSRIVAGSPAEVP